METILVKRKKDVGKKTCDKIINIGATTPSFVIKEIVDKLYRLIITEKLYGNIEIFFQYPKEVLENMLEHNNTTFLVRHDISLNFYKGKDEGFVEFEKIGGKNE